MKIFLDGMDQENSKIQGGKENSEKNKKEKMEERKRRDFYNLEVSILVCSPSIWNALPPLAEPTHMGTSPTK